VIKIEYHNAETDERYEGEPEGPVLLDGLIVKSGARKNDDSLLVDVFITVTYREAK
jgi:hypothetical protein